MAQSQIAFVESFHYWNTHALSGGTFYMALVRGSLDPVGSGVITSASQLSGLTECAGTGYARKPFTLGVDTNGIMLIPSVSWSNGANAWSPNVAAAVMCSAASGGVGIYCWDGPAVADMSILNSTLTIQSAPLNIFLQNPGGI